MQEVDQDVVVMYTLVKIFYSNLKQKQLWKLWGLWGFEGSESYEGFESFEGMFKWIKQ